MDDFFLVGSEPDGESSYPLLTGNILDSEGNLLFRLVRNMLVVNPGNCSKIMADLCGYEIHDSAGHHIFSVRTMFECLPGSSEKSFLTTIKGTFYDRTGKIVFLANSGEPDEHIESHAKSFFGFPGGCCLGYTEEEAKFVGLVLATHGRIQRPLLGEIKNQEILLDGAALINADVTSCTIHVHSGNFTAIGTPRFTRCRFVFHDEAENIRRLVLGLESSVSKGEDQGGSGQ